jgi:hypothetical protein
MTANVSRETKRKVVKPDDCKADKHLFIVSNWVHTPTSQKANSWTCQRCLLTVDGAHDVNKLKSELHADGNA